MISRRAFVVSSVAAIGGALVVGLRMSSPSGLSGDESEAIEIDNWITVMPDNTVTIRVAQMEMGQGTMTAMAQLLAEELEVDWSKLRTEFISIKTHLRHGKIYGRTRTDRSKGVRGSEVLLRTCGAQIRTMFIRAGAAHLAVPESELSAKNSAIVHAPTGRRLTYGELAVEAADVPVPDRSTVTLKDPKDWICIGKSIARVDVPAKVDGTAEYGIDVKLPGLKHAAIAMSPVLGGKLKSYTASDALGRPGVLKVIEIRAARAISAKEERRVEGGIAVVAEHWWQAKAAVEAMAKEWDTGSGTTLDSPTILARMRTGLEGAADKILGEVGDVEAALASAARVVEADFFVPYLEHATLEPMNCTALVTDRSFEVWAPTQVPEDAINTAAEVAGLPVKKGDLHVTQIGGGFGRRLESDYVAQAVQIAKAMKGTPIKLLWSREDTTRHGFYRPTNLSRVRGALDRDGNLTAWTHRIVATSTSFHRGQLGATDLLYAIPNMTVDFVVKPCPVPEGSMRSVALGTHAFVIQCFMDELARAAGKDPYHFQRELLDPHRVPEALRASHGEGLTTRAARLRAVLDEAAQRASWRHALEPRRGRGIAAVEYADAYYAVVVEVTLDGKGWFKVDRVVIAADAGFLVNPRNAEAQLEGSVAFGLTSALYGEITIDQGRVTQGNFDQYRLLRIGEMPAVETHWVPRPDPSWGGVGEPIVAAVTPALVNAIYDAGGPRIRSLPLKNHEIESRTHDY
jgi:isoquinoline 1-oxidoreductase subunit beta